MQRSALCRSRRELSNAYLLANFGFDTAESKPCKVCPLSSLRSDAVQALLEPAAPARAPVSRRLAPVDLVVKYAVDAGAGGEEVDVAAISDVRERRLAKCRENVARFRLYRLRFLQENMRFAAFFKIYQII